VLESFRDDGCIYLELRTTPRKFPARSDSFSEYLDAVVDAIDRNDESKMMVRLILTVNWDFEPDKVKEIVELATTARDAGRCVVGIDVAGNPQKSIFRTDGFTRELVKAHVNGLKLTIHFAEVSQMIAPNVKSQTRT
jgi:adenosine deaminase